MTARAGNVGVVGLVLVLAAACGSDADPASTASTAATSTPSSAEATAPVESTVASSASAEATEQPVAFPIEAFAAISEEPVSEEVAAEFQAILNDMAGGGGMAATVMTADGTWSGAAGSADGGRDVVVDDQFAIASVTKSVVAAQVMRLVEAGDLSLDDLAADRLPPELDFDTNGATIDHLLSMRSGISEYFADEDEFREVVVSDPLHVWTVEEKLDTVSPERGSVGGRGWEYIGTNYLLLGVIIEEVTGRPVAEVLRDGVLAGDGYERLIYQPGERPTEPMAMPLGAPADTLEQNGGYLPSLAAATMATSEGAIASDAPSLARWFRALCAGQIVSPVSLYDMTDFVQRPEYGIGLFNPAQGYGVAVGHAGHIVGYVSWAGCLPEDGAVVVVLSNREFPNVMGMAKPLVDAVIGD